MGLLDAPFGLVKGIVGEDTLAHIPVLNSITGSRTDATKELDKKQKQLAAESELRMRQNAQTRMQALGQSLLAFNPQNQMMAQMFGPQAAFSPQQFAQMAADPSVAGLPWGTGTDEQRIAQVKEKQRQQMIQQQMQPVGPGPAPLAPRAAPQGARRF